jgi:hypothetical protein
MTEILKNSVNTAVMPMLNYGGKTPSDVNELLKSKGKIEDVICKNDTAYFIREYVKIEDRDGEELAIPFQLWPAQAQVLKSFLSDRLIQVLKARQLGLTWLALAYSVWRMIYQSGYSVLALSKTEVDAKELVRRVTFILRNLPDWIISDKQYESTASTVTIKRFKEPSVFQSFPASQDAGRSFTANLVILDEWAFQQWAREIWLAAFPSINRPTGGQVIGLSTIERGTLFEDIWTDPKNGFRKIFLPWQSDPRRDEKWYESTRAALQDGVMSEYPATEEEAFAIPGGAFFAEYRTTIHNRSIQKIQDWYTRYRVMDYGLDALACYWIYLDSQGYGRIYREVHLEGLVISSAAYEVLKASGTPVPGTVAEWDILTPDEKKKIADKETEKFSCTYAPPDLFSTSSQTGRASSDVWRDNGIFLTKTKNDFEQGCISMSEWLHQIEIKDEQTAEVYKTARLTVDEGCAPVLCNSLLNIQKDKHNPKVYAKQPHGLTHSVDAIRYFCTEHVYTTSEPAAVVEKWVKDWDKRRLASNAKWEAGAD